jgi:hypothetical protein
MRAVLDRREDGRDTTPKVVQFAAGKAGSPGLDEDVADGGGFDRSGEHGPPGPVGDAPAEKGRLAAAADHVDGANGASAEPLDVVDGLGVGAPQISARAFFAPGWADLGSAARTFADLRDQQRAYASAPRLQTGLGSGQWCLQLLQIAPGQQYQAVLHGAATDLTLTLTARHNWPLPALTAFLALAAALVLLWLTTRFLPDAITSHELTSAKADEAGIDGLRNWVNHAEGRLADTDVLARLRWAKRYGKAQALGGVPSSARS